MLLGAFLGIAIHGAIGGPLWLTLIATGLCVAVVGMVLERGIFRPLSHKPFVTIFIATLAIGLIVRNGIVLIWGTASRPGPLIADGRVDFVGVTMAWQAVVILLTTVLLVALQWFVFHRTNLGIRLRATADNPDMARIAGVRTSRVRLLVYGVAIGLAGVAGVLVAPIAPLDPNMGGLALILKVFIAAVIGGFGSEIGAVAGGLVLGIGEVLVAGYVTSTYRDAVVYMLLLVLLIVRREGLFRAVRLREA